MKHFSLKTAFRICRTSRAAGARGRPRHAAARRSTAIVLSVAFLLAAPSCIVRTQGDLPGSYAVSRHVSSEAVPSSTASAGTSRAPAALSSNAAVFSTFSSAVSSDRPAGPSAAVGGASRGSGGSGGKSQAAVSVSWPAGGPVPSPLFLPSIDGTRVYANSAASIDLSYISYGFVKIHLVKALASSVKVWIHKSSGDYYYDLNKSGATESFPLQMGSGSYSISVLQKGAGGGYYYLASTTVNVQLARAQDPFLVPSQFVCYSAGSQAVSIARRLVAGMDNNYERISTVLSYVAGHLSYDYSLAGSVQSGYVPDIDYDLSRGKGICFDYAAVSAAMLRCLGYPTKLVTGYVENGAVYHAWNEVYLPGQGWIKVLSVKVDTSGWSRVDVTFISTSTSSAKVARYIGDGSNYRTVYVY